jgi:endonuclease-3
MDKLKILEKIDQMVKPLKPPVFAFERSARRTPFKVLISVLLSSRTKDPVTHQAVDQLFSVADTPQKMLLLEEQQIAKLIFPVGFYQQKAKHIKKIAEILAKSYPGSIDTIPPTFAELTALPGVGRKTANLVLALAFNQPAIAVDTHVFRISKRLGWARGNKPEEVEQELEKLFPPGHWNRINQTLVGFGQVLCKPINPMCHRCEITDYCLYFKEKKPSSTFLKKGGAKNFY